MFFIRKIKNIDLAAFYSLFRHAQSNFSLLHKLAIVRKLFRLAVCLLLQFSINCTKNDLFDSNSA